MTKPRSRQVLLLHVSFFTKGFESRPIETFLFFKLDAQTENTPDVRKAEIQRHHHHWPGRAINKWQSQKTPI